MADDLVVREWIEFEAEYGDIAPIDEPDDPHTVDEMIAEHNALAGAYLAVVAERDEVVAEWRALALSLAAKADAHKEAVDLWKSYFFDPAAPDPRDTQLAAMTAERDAEAALSARGVKALEQMTNDFLAAKAQLTASEAARGRMAEAASRLLNQYVNGVNSGDWGNWDPETDDEVIALRAALAEPGKAGEP